MTSCEEAPELTVREALNTSLADLLEDDERVFLLGEDIADPMGGSYKVTAGLSTRFGEGRVINSPISESAIVGAGIGSALVGRRPIVELMYIDFVAVAMDQLVNQAAFLSYMSGGQARVPLTIRCQGGGQRSSAAQHSKSLEAWFAHVPGIKFVAPSTASDAYWLLRAAVEDANPVIFYEANRLYRQKGILDRSCRPVDLDGSTIRREGVDLTLVGWAGTVASALEVAEELDAQWGLSAEVIDLRWLAPLEYTTVLESVGKTRRLAIVQEAWRAFGVGAEMAAVVTEAMFGELRVPVMRFGAQHCPHPFSPVLERAMQPTTAEMAAAIAKKCGA